MTGLPHHRAKQGNRIAVLVFALLFTAIVVFRTVYAREDVSSIRPRSVLVAAEGFTTLEEPQYGAPIEEVLSARAPVEFSEGWAALDVENNQVFVLDHGGNLVRRFGREGRGPAEFTNPGAIAILDSLLVVIDRTGSRLSAFSLDGRFLRHVPVESSGCVGTGLRHLGVASGRLVILRTCVHRDGRTSARWEWMTLEGRQELIDERVLFDPREKAFRPFVEPVMQAIGENVYLAVTPDPCVTVVSRGSETSRICHPDSEPMMLTDSMKAALAQLKTRFADPSISILVPDRYPPFDRLLEVEGQLAFHIGLTETTEAIEVVRGTSLKRIVLPTRVSPAFGRTSVLFAHEVLEGTAFAVVPIP